MQENGSAAGMVGSTAAAAAAAAAAGEAAAAPPSTPTRRASFASSTSPGSPELEVRVLLLVAGCTADVAIAFRPLRTGTV